jgi:mannose-6-phosphate isomerase-like protein (cupin superfamily)
MKKFICCSVVFASLCVLPAWAQKKPEPATPGQAIIIKDAAMQAKLKDMIAAKLQDDAVKIVNTPEGNLGIFLIHLNPGQTPQEPVSLMSHDEVSEVYYVLKGEGFLFHGGTMANPTPRDLTTTGGPSKGGPGQNKQTEQVGPGDLFVIPPNTPHQVNLGAKTEMLYLVIRIDPKKHLEYR